MAEIKGLKKVKLTFFIPTIAFGVFLYALTKPSFEWSFAVIILLALIAAIISSVHHAEVLAHRLGEIIGTLILVIIISEGSGAGTIKL
ncbi:MAG: hypothetical protein HQK50_07935 [Oligoflexia bacterium]|nr:hypothetical protein [Oligoflexia bacterium]